MRRPRVSSLILPSFVLPPGRFVTWNTFGHALGVLALFVLVGCPEPGPSDDEPETPPEDPDSLTCDPPLALGTETPALPVLSITRLEARGGTGEYLFELVDNESGGLLNPLTGAYLTGPTEGVLDRFRLTDAGCEGAAEAELEILTSITVSPMEAELPYGESFRYEITGGSGDYTCSLSLLQTFGTVTDDCVFTAASFPATDEIEVHDQGTGESVFTVVHSVEAVELLVDAPRVYIPFGSRYVYPILGGSGHYDVERTAGVSVDWDDGAFVPAEDGLTWSEFVIRDRFVDVAIDVAVRAVAPLPVPLERWGNRSERGGFLSPGDVTGDGIPDLLFGSAETDHSSTDGGAVFLYEGTPDGLAPSPVASWGGWIPGEAFGTSLAVADFDDDGRPDLAVGAPLASPYGILRAGSVYIYYGLEDGGFAPESGRELHGEEVSDHFGSSLATGDFDGDGVWDLAVGAPDAEDNLALQVMPGQGGVFVYLGSLKGLPMLPDSAVWGKAVDESGFYVPAINARIGVHLAAADTDLDGFWDLAVGAPTRSADTGGLDDGAVHIYRGKGADVVDNGGLHWDPVKTFVSATGSFPDSELGTSIAFAELGGSEHPELVVGAPGRDDKGAVFVLEGRDYLFDSAREEDIEDAQTWVAAGEDTGDRLGRSIAVADLSGDGRPDLLVGAPALDSQGEHPHAQNNSEEQDSGRLAFFEGAENVFFEDDPIWLGELGPEPTPEDPAQLDAVDLLGTHVGALAASDTQAGKAVTFALGDDSLGHDVGRPLTTSPVAPADWTALEFPGGPSGQKLGAGLALLGDIDGDGRSDIGVGSPYQHGSDGAADIGTAHVFFSSTEALNSESPWALGGFAMHGLGDYLGATLAPAGDFDGDGYDDFIVFAPGEDRPSSYGIDFSDPAACAGARTGAGAAWIFRGGEELPTGPSFVFWGAATNAALAVVAEPLDWNGDGLTDLAFGEATYSTSGVPGRGAVRILEGRPWSGLGIDAICNHDEALLGLRSIDNFGTSVSRLGDLDGDGCEELAVGAPREDLAGTNGGSIRILFGHGESCRAEPGVITMSGQISEDEFARTLVGGGDLDGDGLPDLVVSASERSVGIGNELGSVWMVPGYFLASIEPEFWTGSDPEILWPFAIDDSRYRLDGWVDDEEFGAALALVPNVTEDGRPGIAIGAPLANLGGLHESGGVRLHIVDTSASGSWGHFLDPDPVAVFGGENHHGDGAEVGDRLYGGVRQGEPTLLIGGTGAHSLSTSGGAAWAVDLSPLAPN